MAVAIPPRLWTIDEFIKMDSFGLLDGGRYELIGGSITPKVGQNGPHLTSVNLIYRALSKVFGEDYSVAQNTPYNLPPHDRPEPDLIVFPGDARDYEPGWVVAENVVLAVEVADTRLDTAEAKIEVYARHGIREYWILDLPRRRLRRHLEPDASSGLWAYTEEFDSRGSVEINGGQISIASLLPREQSVE